ncbi:hypothetical protein DAEQUDRAFT_808385 [Daedalea quercina L-15889]|uniref:Uncharacterized protein n=1 Tax=Daedalea quercina L-15889 TaxID=1314783 RepID=A0A165TD80_9APHY|nr:hypothetical protein DAEQUDRAFT_808385 [Daedalea quercina L-15889]
MPHPNRPLADIFVSGRLNTPSQVLTPRTPHSRNGRAEEGFTDVELDELPEYEEEEEYPFLRSEQLPPTSVSPGPASTAFPPGYRSRGDDHEISGPKPRMCPSALMIAERLIYLSAAFFIFGIFALFWMAFRRDMEDEALGRISYHHYYVFPLTGAQYAYECERASWYQEGPGYWDTPFTGPLDVVHQDRRLKLHGHSPICSSTVTYQLDGQADLATDLALMAQVAALARERNSTFFVDDTYWDRGRWADYFEDVSKLYPGPEPGCQRPTPEEYVACPRTARHWVVNSHTAKYHLNASFNEKYEDSSTQGVSRRRPIYDHAVWSLSHIIRPDSHMISLIRAARSEIASILSLPYDSHTQYEPYIGVQLTHQLSPNVSTPSLKDYVQAVHDAWTRLYPNTPIPASSGAGHFPAPPIMYIAADAPEALRGYVAAFTPATAKFALDLSTNADLRALAPEHTYDPVHFREVPVGERISLTRGMLVDLALVSGLWTEDAHVVPGATVCAAGSNACELAAIGLGWERAFGDGDGRQQHPVGDHAKRRWVPLGAPHIDWNGFVLPVHNDII